MLTRWAMLRTRAKVCQELISPPVLQTRSRVPSCFLLTFTDESMCVGVGVCVRVQDGGGSFDGVQFPLLLNPKNRPHSLVVPLGSSESFLSWHAVREQRKVAICPGILISKRKSDVLLLNLDQILLKLANPSDTQLEGVDARFSCNAVFNRYILRLLLLSHFRYCGYSS